MFLAIGIVEWAPNPILIVNSPFFRFVKLCAAETSAIRVGAGCAGGFDLYAHVGVSEKGSFTGSLKESITVL